MALSSLLSGVVGADFSLPGVSGAAGTSAIGTMDATMPKTIERPISGVDLAVSSPAEPDAASRPARLQFLPWLAAAVIGSAAAVLLGWVVVGAAVAAGWLTAPALPPAVVLDAIAQAWLGVHGSAFSLGGLTIGLAPLGVTALVGIAMAAVARMAAGQREEETPGLRAALLIAGACTLAYSAITLVIGTFVGAPRQAAAAFVGAVGISGVGSLIGALRACGVRGLALLPGWLRGVPRGALAGIAGLAAASTLALAVAIGTHTAQIGALQRELAPDAVGAVLLVFCYLAYAPTLLLWAGSYVLGAGFSVGTGTPLTPTTAALGLLPGIPLAGALPVVPPPNGVLLLACGPLAGALAGVASCRKLGRLGVSSTLLTDAVGAGLAALASGLIWTAASWLARGDLGGGRLVDLGPRFPELLLYGTLPVAAGGVLAGLAYSALARRARARAQAAAELERSEETTQLPFGL